MKDIQKIKEFFSKPMEAITTAYEAKGEYFKPSIRKDKSNPNFLYVDIAYPEGSDVLSVGGSKTMGGQDRESGAAKALSMGNNIVKKLQSKYNIEDIEVKDLKNGKVEVFAVSDDFIKMSSPSLDEVSQTKIPYLPLSKKEVETLNSKGKVTKTFAGTGFSHSVDPKTVNTYLNTKEVTYTDWNTGQRVKAPVDVEYSKQVGSISITVYGEKNMNEAKEETAVDMAKKQLDALGVKYELSGNKFRPFKAIYRPTNKPDRWYDEFEDIIHLFNLGSAVKQSMSEAKEEDKVDTITMDVPLFLRMLEYSREDAEQDLDLHDVTEKANVLGKERGILSMDDYAEIVGAAEEINEVNLKQSKLSSSEYQKAKKLKNFKSSDWKWNADEDLYTKVNEGELTEEADQKQANNYAYQFMQYFDKMRRIVGGNFGDDTRKEFEKLVQSKFSKHTVNETEELAEAFVPSNIKEFAKRKGVSSLVNKVAGWAEKVGKGIRGGTAIGMNYSTLVLDITYQGSEIRINTNNDTVTLYDEPVRSFDEFKQVYLDNQDESDNGLEEKINEALTKINEELCPAGKAYIKRRQAAGEKSSAYLSGRGVKVCKGQMSGKSKKKK